MTLKEIIDAMVIFPPFFKDIALIAIILSLVEVSPLKLNPWKWIKEFIALPARLTKLENDVENDRAYRWRSMIISRADHVRAGDKLSKEKWKDTIDTTYRYEDFCKILEEKDSNFKNGEAKVAIAYLRKKHEVVYENNDYLVDEDYDEEELIS